MDVNVILRGQSNALLFADFGGAGEMEKQLEQKLGGGVDIHLIYQWGNGSGQNTINSGSAFMAWDTDGKQAGFMSYLNSLPEDLQDNPTITLWMHNEDEMKNNPATADWVSEVRTDAAMVRDALGQGAGSTPYLFTWVPYNYGQGTANVQAGMRELAADASFNADLALDAMNGIAMDGDGYANSSHMGSNDAFVVAGRLADALAPIAGELANGGVSTPEPTPAPVPAPTPVSTTPVEVSAGSGPDALVLKIAQDVYQGAAQYTVSVDGAQVGGTFTAAALKSSGQADTLTLKGDWGPGEHKVEVKLLNDAWGGSAETDRNLHVVGATFNGEDVAGAAQAIETDWQPGGFSFTEAGTTPTPAPTPTTPAPTTPTTPASGGWVESFDDGNWGRFTHFWGNIETADGDVTLTGLTGQMEKPSGREAGDGYGLREVVAKIEGSGPGPAIVMWPGSDVWPGPEIDIGEINVDGSGQYGALHWKGDDGSDQYHIVDIGDHRGKFVTYGIDWRPDYVAFLVDGVEKGRVTHHVPVDFAHGGEDDTIGWLSSIGYGPGDGKITVDEVRYTPSGATAPNPTPTPVPTPTPAPTPVVPVELSAGSGPDALVLKISQDAYDGSAQYTVSVDGVQVGETFTASALKSSGQSDTLTLKGDWGPGEHKVEVELLNDAWGGTAATDRNLHVDGATFNGKDVSGAAQAIEVDWQPGAFAFTEAAAPTSTPTPTPTPTESALTAGSGPDSLVLKISQDAYQGSAQYTVSVDGVQVGETFTASASHAAGQSDTLILKGDWAAGEHEVEVKFLNDAWGGSAETDRNLHVDSATYNGKDVAGAAQAIEVDWQPGAFSFTEAAAPAPTPTPAPAARTGTDGADLFEAGPEGAVFTGGGGRDLFVFEAGDGAVTITDFASKADRLVFVDMDREDVTAEAAASGPPGLLVHYGDGGTVFLAGVSTLAERDLAFG